MTTTDQHAKRRLNRYNCPCGKSILSEDLDQGTTPFMMPCACGRSAYSAFYRVSTKDLVLPVDIVWYKPTSGEVQELTKAMREHVAVGGLVYRVVDGRTGLDQLRLYEGRQWR